MRILNVEKERESSGIVDGEIFLKEKVQAERRQPMIYILNPLSFYLSLVSLNLFPALDLKKEFSFEKSYCVFQERV